VDVTDLGPALAAEIDVCGMFAEVAGLPRQLREGYENARARLAGAFFGTFPAIPPAEPTGVALCGMGGSAIGADLVLACLPGLSVPATVVRGYALPEWVGPEALVIVVSYSGETEEALACGPHPPLSGDIERQVIRDGITMTPIWSNCSGKHTGMLALARHHGWPLAGYHRLGHPVQTRLLASVERWTGLPRDQIVCLAPHEVEKMRVVGRFGLI